MAAALQVEVCRRETLLSIAWLLLPRRGVTPVCCVRDKVACTTILLLTGIQVDVLLRSQYAPRFLRAAPEVRGTMAVSNSSSKHRWHLS